MLNTIMAISFVVFSGFSLVKLISLSQQRHQLLTCAFTQSTQLLNQDHEKNGQDQMRSSKCYTQRHKSQFISRDVSGLGHVKKEFQTNLTLQSYKTAKDQFH